MHSRRFIFSQIMDFMPERDFRRLVAKYRGDYKASRFTCRDQLHSLFFAQLTFRESLREIEDCLRPRQYQLYPLGFSGSISRSTMADANANWDWRIYQDLALLLIARARKLYADERLAVDLDAAVYAIDSTTVDLCLSIFPWADFRTTKAGIKMHTQIDLRGPIPTCIFISEASQHDVRWLDDLLFDAGAFYVMDRGYMDFGRMDRIVRSSAFFVTRAKDNLRFSRQQFMPVDFSAGIRSDQIGRPTIPKSRADFPSLLRRVRYFDKENDRYLIFLTNNLKVPALTIAKLYRLRWQIELFFKWIKQNLRIKAFFGREPNAVKTQIWSAIAVCVLLLIIRKKLGLGVSMHTILTVLSVNIFEKVPLHELFVNVVESNIEYQYRNQLLFRY